MNQNDLDNIDIRDELEFNDGVGDALTQKNSYSFSWKKTIIVLTVGLTCVVFLTIGILEIGKLLLNMNQHQYVENDADVTIESVISAPVDDTWDAIPEDDLSSNNENINNKVIPQASNAVNTINVEKNDETKAEKIVASDEPTIKATINPIVKPQPIIQKEAPKKQNKKVTSSPNVYRVIAGSFSNYNNAQRELNRIKAMGFQGYVWSLTSSTGKVSYKVQLAAFSSYDKANSFVNTLKKKKISAFISKQ